MGFVPTSRRTSGPTTTCSFNTTTRVLSGTVTFPGNSVSGLTVNAYIDGSGSSAGSATTASDGTWSIDLSGVSGISSVGHSFSAVVTYNASTSAGAVSTVTVGTAVYTGDDLLKRTLGMNGAAEATGSLTRTGTSVSGISLTSGGTGYEPGSWQVVTTGTGGGSGFRGSIQANASGVLDPGTFTVTGTDEYGVARSGGTNYTSDPASIIVTRYCTKFLLGFQFQQGSTVNGDYLFQAGASAIAMQLLTGFYPRVDLNNAVAGSGLRMRGAGTPLTAGAFNRIMVAIDTTLDANAGGLRMYLDDTNISDYSGANGYVYNKAVSGSANGRVDIRNQSVLAIGLGNAATASTGLHGALKLSFVAAGYPAIDGIAGTATVPDLTVQAVRDRFTENTINISNGSGWTGRQPQVFLRGEDMATGNNLGFGGAFTPTGTFTL
jgi:hypothetical protein